MNVPAKITRSNNVLIQLLGLAHTGSHLISDSTTSWLEGNQQQSDVIILDWTVITLYIGKYLHAGAWGR